MNFKTFFSLCVTLLALNISPIFSINYYVSIISGNNSFVGTSPTTAFSTIQKASDVSQAGDTIFVMNGTYLNSASNAVLTHKKSGLPTKWIVIKNFKDHKPVLSFNAWHGIKIEGSYVEINGLTIRGNNSYVTLDQALNQPKSCKNTGGADYDPKFNGNGIYTDGRTGNKVHHITVKNCTIYECGGSGIQTVQSDYVIIENNIIYNNAWYSVFAPSGISIYQSWNFDSQTGIKNIIRNNICYGNRMFVPWPAVNCTFTDGNGIIIDDSKNTQSGSTLGAYKGRTLVTNNICYKNGGSGIHSFLSEHVDIINNTAFKNAQTPSINNGEIYPSKSADVRIFNNILWSQASKKLNSSFQNGADIVYDYNLHFGGSFPTLTGSNFLKADPLFKDTTKANFQLTDKSPAINKGIDVLSGANAPLVDFLGNKRPFNGKIDIGAYEFGYTTSSNEVEIVNSLFNVSPNPVSDRIIIAFASSNDQKPVSVELFNANGMSIYTNAFAQAPSGQTEVIVDTAHYPTGLYFVKVTQGNQSQTKKIIKL
jgi:hypothetical protein